MKRCRSSRYCFWTFHWPAGPRCLELLRPALTVGHPKKGERLLSKPYQHCLSEATQPGSVYSAKGPWHPMNCCGIFVTRSIPTQDTIAFQRQWLTTDFYHFVIHDKKFLSIQVIAQQLISKNMQSNSDCMFSYLWIFCISPSKSSLDHHWSIHSAAISAPKIPAWQGLLFSNWSLKASYNWLGYLAWQPLIKAVTLSFCLRKEGKLESLLAFLLEYLLTERSILFSSSEKIRIQWYLSRPQSSQILLGHLRSHSH